MRGSSRVSSTASVLGIIAGLFIFGAARAQPGTVLSSQKISDLEGNFTAILDNLDELGGAVAHLGDLDGDGPSASALAIGAAFDDDGGGDRGAVYILFQAADGTVLSHQKISDLSNFPGTPLDNVDEFGSSIAFLGDLDGAGPSVGALAVGAISDDDGGSARGAVYILFLSSSGTVLSWQKISNTQGSFSAALDNLDEFGGSLASLGDLDGAGPSAHAIAVGAVGDDDGGDGRGAVYVLFVAGSGTVMSYQKISSTQGNLAGPLEALDEFGTSLASLGDLDGAGPSALALAVGAAFDDDGGADRGAVYVLFLGSSGSVLSEQKISDTQGNFNDFFSDFDEFGGALAHLGDIDGAAGGVTAMAVGVAGDDDGGEDRGAFHVLFLNSDGTCAGSQKVSDFYGNLPVPLGNLDGFGTSLVALGDLDGAGPSKVAVAVGATGDDDGGTDRGAAYILFLAGAANSYTLTYTAGPNGTISGTSPQTVTQGGNGTQVTAVPDPGYHFVDWSDGVLTASRTETNVTADLAVTANFAINEYTLTYTAGPNGTLSGTSPQTVAHGASGSEVTAVANPSYQFVSWSDGVLTAARTETNVTANVNVTANFQGVTGVSPFPQLGSESGLGRASPNPFHPRTTIPFRLEQAADVRLDIWDLNGRMVRQLVRARLSAGDHQAEWDGRDDSGQVLSTGTYFYRMAIDGRLVSGAGKALLLR